MGNDIVCRSIILSKVHSLRGIAPKRILKRAEIVRITIADRSAHGHAGIVNAVTGVFGQIESIGIPKVVIGQVRVRQANRRAPLRSDQGSRIAGSIVSVIDGPAQCTGDQGMMESQFPGMGVDQCAFRDFRMARSGQRYIPDQPGFPSRAYNFRREEHKCSRPGFEFQRSVCVVWPEAR